MGKGDKKTQRGKIALGTFGKLRPRRKKFVVRPKFEMDNLPKE